MRNTAHPTRIGRSRQASCAEAPKPGKKEPNTIPVSSKTSYVIISDVSSTSPVTESEIQLVLGALGAEIASIFSEDE
jgi:hypothetical protein